MSMTVAMSRVSQLQMLSHTRRQKRSTQLSIGPLTATYTERGKLFSVWPYQICYRRLRDRLLTTFADGMGLNWERRRSPFEGNDGAAKRGRPRLPRSRECEAGVRDAKSLMRLADYRPLPLSILYYTYVKFVYYITYKDTF